MTCDSEFNQRIQYLKSHLDLRDIAPRYLGEGKRAGQYLLFSKRQDDTKPSFVVDQYRYRDYGDDARGGDVIDFIQEMEGLSRGKAVEFLENTYGTTLAATSTVRCTTSPNEPPDIAFQHAAIAVAQQAYHYLWSDRPDAGRVLDYLHDERGLSDEIIHKAYLGYNPKWQETQYMRPDGGVAKLPPGITIPWRYDGIPWALRVRCRVDQLAVYLEIDEDRLGEKVSSKYMNLSGSKPNAALYHRCPISARKSILLTEGEFDCLLSQQKLGDNITVVTLGSAASTLNSRQRNDLLQAEHIYILLDNDEAGQRETAKLAQELGSKGIPLQLPIGKDITEFIVQHHGDLAQIMPFHTS